MYGRTRVSKKDHYYMCSSKRIKNEPCSNRSINIDKLDNFIWNILFGNSNFITRLENELTNTSPDKKKLLDELSFEKKRLESLKNDKQKSINLCVKGIISENDLAETVKSIDFNIRKSEMVIKELSLNQILHAEGQMKLEEIKNKFVEYTKLSTHAQKWIAIREVINNIIITFDKYSYVIVIEYKFGFASETWRSANERADVFTRPIYDENGKMKATLFSAPKPISNPNDNSTELDFLNYRGFLANFKANNIPIIKPGDVPFLDEIEI
jgi:hypothetical protein